MLFWSSGRVTKWHLRMLRATQDAHDEVHLGPGEVLCSHPCSPRSLPVLTAVPCFQSELPEAHWLMQGTAGARLEGPGHIVVSGNGPENIWPHLLKGSFLLCENEVPLTEGEQTAPVWLSSIHSSGTCPPPCDQCHARNRCGVYRQQYGLRLCGACRLAFSTSRH